MILYFSRTFRIDAVRKFKAVEIAFVDQPLLYISVIK